MKKIFRAPFVFIIAFCLCIILASCTENGFIPTSCSPDSFLPSSPSGCNHTQTYTKNENVIASTCSQSGSYDFVTYCSACNIELSRVQKTEDKSEHTPADPVRENEKAASCLEAGYYDKVIYCSECDEEISRVKKAEKKGEHIPADPVRENETAASCLEDGTYDEVVYCSECDEEISRTQKTKEKSEHIPASPVIENETADSCLETGTYDEVIYCSECDAEISRVEKTKDKSEHIPAAPVRENETAASCLEAGTYDEVVYCSKCNTEISRVEKTNAKGEHMPTAPIIENETGTSCLDGTYDEVVYCSGCDAELSRETKNIPHALLDDYEYEIDACGVSGTYKYSFCTICKTFVNAENIVLHPHSFIRKLDTVLVRTWFECEYCGLTIPSQENDDYNDYYHDDYLHYKYCGHEPEVSSIKEPTCTEEGFLVLTCSKCGYLSKRAFPSLGHNWNRGVVTKAATCTEDGKKVYTCKRCGEEKDETIEARHKWDTPYEIIDISESCIEKGIERRTCTVCGETEDFDYYANHDFTEWECIKEETCTEEGIYKRTCKVCSIEEIDKRDRSHDYETVDELKATCTEDGYLIRLCKKCKQYDNEYYDALGHDLEYDYDEAYHWIDCRRDGCDYNEKDDKAEHEIELTVETEEIDDGTQIVYRHTLKDACKFCDYSIDYGTSELHLHYLAEIVNGKVPTCTEEGEFPGLKCAVEGCEEWLIEKEPAPPLGHLWYNCNCIRCGETLLEMTLGYSGGEKYYCVMGLKENTETIIVIPAYYNDIPVERINPTAFENCSHITSITIPETITMIGTWAFAGCTSLTEINYNATYPLLGNWGSSSVGKDNGFSRNPIFLAASYSYNIFYNAGIDGEGIKLNIGKNVTAIPTKLFYTGSIETAPKITSIEFEDGSALAEIRSSAFYAFDDVTKITIPVSVKAIRLDAFYGWNSLTDVYYAGSKEEWSKIDIDSGNDSLTNAIFHFGYK